VNKIKFAHARLAKVVYRYTTIKEEIYRRTAAVWFNKMCRTLSLLTSLLKCIKYIT